MRFTKMHGIGNDYIYVNGFAEKVENPSEAARRLSDRHTGVGGDGLVLILPSDKADFRMDMYNSDGSQAQMCGNAIRCVAKYVYDTGMTQKDVITVDTLAGIRKLFLTAADGTVSSVRVDMGEPVLIPREIPVLLPGDKAVNITIDILGETYGMTCVSMGNPHAGVFLPEVERLPLERIGPVFESHGIFPQRVNTEFCKVLSRDKIRMRVWERGAGETMACGTGACAALVAASLCGHTGRNAEIILNGGFLKIEWEKDNHVYMTGPAEFVFDGETI